MAVNDNDQGNNAQQQERGERLQGQMGAQTSQQQQSQQSQQQRGFSFNRMGVNGRGTLLGRNPSSEVLTKLAKALEEAYASADQTYTVKVIPIDRENDNRLSLSCVVVGVQDNLNKDAGVALHTLILEGSADNIPPRFEQINGQNVEIIRVAGDAYDNEMKKVILEYARKVFPQARWLDADGEVVHRGFKLDDQTLLHMLAANAGIAAQARVMQADPNFRELNLAEAERDTTLVVRPNFAASEYSDPVGLPVRGDVVVDFSAVSNAQQQNQGLGIDRSTTLSRISGFVDLFWAPQNPDAGVMNPWAPQLQQNQFQRYAARFVMTGMESTGLLSISSQLLALVSAMSLREGNSWFQYFDSKRRVAAGVDIRDIGAIGLEVNFEGNPSGIGGRIDTKGEAFNMGSLSKLIGATVAQGLVMSLDVPECGSSTWYNGVFSAAAEGSDAAYNAIIAAAQILTNGRFGAHFPANAPIVTDELNRIHMGYYSDADGVHDIRKLDYLAVLNLIGERDIGTVRDWSDTFMRVEYPLALRLAARKKIITGLLGDSVVFTGFARRVTFTTAFIDALVLGCKEAGLQVRNQQPVADLAGYERATAQNLGSMLLNTGNTGVFNYGYSGQAGVQGAMPRGFTRWNSAR